METTNKNYTLYIAIPVVIAGILVAGFLMRGKSNEPEQTANVNVSVQKPTDTTNSGIIEPGDHVYGNREAEIVLVLYSDIECPFCKRFHKTMNQLMETYGKNNKLAWVYRHFPLTQLHPTAFEEAEATECAAELGGEEMFWKYIDVLVARTETGATTEQMVAIAGQLGLDQTKFRGCLASGKYASKIEASTNSGTNLFNAIKDKYNLSGLGTPFSTIYNNSKGTLLAPVPGALPYESMVTIIEEALKTNN